MRDYAYLSIEAVLDTNRYPDKFDIYSQPAHRSHTLAFWYLYFASKVTLPLVATYDFGQTLHLVGDRARHC